MKIITLIIAEQEGLPPVQVVPSDGVTPELGTNACRYAVRVFEAQAIEAEVQRRVAAQTGGEGENDECQAEGIAPST